MEERRGEERRRRGEERRGEERRRRGEEERRRRTMFYSSPLVFQTNFSEFAVQPEEIDSFPSLLPVVEGSVVAPASSSSNLPQGFSSDNTSQARSVVL